MSKKAVKSKVETSRHFCCRTVQCCKKVGWLSLQDDGSVSFGLSDKTFVSPRQKFVSGIWNAYNRIGIDFLVESKLLDGVRNPHFTFHPPLKFHLKDQYSEKGAATTIFSGIADVGIVLGQQNQLPWIRAISNPIPKMSEHKLRSGNLGVELFSIDSEGESASVKIEIDILDSNATLKNGERDCWLVKWGQFSYRCKMSLCAPQISTLAWYYEY